MASVLEGFFVRLGFEVDSASQRAFSEGVALAEKRVKQLAGAGLAVGTAVAAGVAKASTEITKLSDLSIKTGAGVESILTLRRAIARVGGTAEEADNLVVGLTNSLKAMGDPAGFLQQSLGVSLRDSKGELKDAVNLLIEVRDSLSKVDPVVAQEIARNLGINADSFQRLERKDFTEWFKKSREAVDAWGGSLNRNAEQVSKATKEVSGLIDQLKLASEVAAGEFVTESGFVDLIHRISEDVPKATGKVVDLYKALSKEASEKGWLKALLDKPFVGFEQTQTRDEDAFSGQGLAERFASMSGQIQQTQKQTTAPAPESVGTSSDWFYKNTEEENAPKVPDKKVGDFVRGLSDSKRVSPTVMNIHAFGAFDPVSREKPTVLPTSKTVNISQTINVTAGSSNPRQIAQEVARSVGDSTKHVLALSNSGDL